VDARRSFTLQYYALLSSGKSKNDLQSTSLDASVYKLQTRTKPSSVPLHEDRCPSNSDQRCEAFISVLFVHHELISSGRQKYRSSSSIFSSCISETHRLQFSTTDDCCLVVVPSLSFELSEISGWSQRAERIGQRERERCGASV
jgi:hypothetical protein